MESRRVVLKNLFKGNSRDTDIENRLVNMDGGERGG